MQNYNPAKKVLKNQIKSFLTGMKSRGDGFTVQQIREEMKKVDVELDMVILFFSKSKFYKFFKVYFFRKKHF